MIAVEHWKYSYDFNQTFTNESNVNSKYWPLNWGLSP